MKLLKEARLFVMISTLLVRMTFLLPSLHKVMHASKGLTCLTHLKIQGVAFQLYFFQWRIRTEAMWVDLTLRLARALLCRMARWLFLNAIGMPQWMVCDNVTIEGGITIYLSKDMWKIF